jgi:hypothetical protein
MARVLNTDGNGRRAATVGDLKRLANPRIEIEQIVERLSKRADEIMKEKSVIFSEAYKQASRENPDLSIRYAQLNAMIRRSGISNDE